MTSCKCSSTCTKQAKARIPKKNNLSPGRQLPTLIGSGSWPTVTGELRSLVSLSCFLCSEARRRKRRSAQYLLRRYPENGPKSMSHCVTPPATSALSPESPSNESCRQLTLFSTVLWGKNNQGYSGPIKMRMTTPSLFSDVCGGFWLHNQHVLGAFCECDSARVRPFAAMTPRHSLTYR